MGTFVPFVFYWRCWRRNLAIAGASFFLFTLNTPILRASPTVGTTAPYYALTASSVAAAKNRLTEVRPALASAWLAPWFGSEELLRPLSCLGYYGPLGPFGPLGNLSPANIPEWIPEIYQMELGIWHFLQDLLPRDRRAMSQAGSLGEAGPLNPEYGEWQRRLPNEFVTHLNPGGLWGVLGPAGVLGPLGPLGALGPFLAHGRATNPHGEYIDEAGNVIHSIEVPWSDREKRTYPLVEHYNAAFAAEQKLDTSFMITGELQPGEFDHFLLENPESQTISIVVTAQSSALPYWAAMSNLLFSALQPAPLRYQIPLMVPGPIPFTFLPYAHQSLFDDFDLHLEILNAAGRVQAEVKSESRDMVDWIQVRVPRGKELRLQVRKIQGWAGGASSTYRLIVVGGGRYMAPLTTSGPQIQTLTLDD